MKPFTLVGVFVMTFCWLLPAIHLQTHAQVTAKEKIDNNLKDVNDQLDILLDLDSSNYRINNGYQENSLDWSALEKLNAVHDSISFIFNEKTREYLTLFAGQRVANFEVICGLANHYFPAIEFYLNGSKLPGFLKYLPGALSCWNYRAVSSGGAGFWNLNYFIARKYGLKINDSLDERRDLEKSTKAAVEYLIYLHKKYNDWLLTIAAFASSPAEINRALHRNPGKKDFWSIYPDLSPEINDYVPAFLALVFIFENKNDFNLTDKLPDLPGSEKVIISKEVDLQLASTMFQVPLEELKFINPVFTGNFVFADPDYPLFLPEGTADIFNTLSDSLYLVQDSIMLAQRQKREDEFERKILRIPENHVQHIYKVESGNTLGYIARISGTKVSDIKIWNDLSGDRINIGQDLVLYLPPGKELRQRSRESQSNIQKPETDSGDYQYYIVKPGDTLWGIAEKYPGVTVEKIKNLNNITDNITPGQKLKIKEARK